MVAIVVAHGVGNYLSVRILGKGPFDDAPMMMNNEGIALSRQPRVHDR